MELRSSSKQDKGATQYVNWNVTAQDALEVTFSEDNGSEYGVYWHFLMC